MPAKSHGLTGTKLYQMWANMKSRCYNKNRKDSQWYSLKGITVCDSWLKFLNFQSWALLNGYEDGLSIERIKNEIGYTPENCIFIPLKDQNKNKTSNFNLTYEGETKILSDWAIQFGVHERTIASRLKAGWSIHDAFTKKMRTLINSRLFEIGGEKYTQTQLAVLLNTTKHHIGRSLKKGLTINQIIEKYTDY